MKNYAVFLEGANFRLRSHEPAVLSGFFVTKRVLASSPEEAAALAVRSAWQDPRVAGQEQNTPRPHMQATVVHELLDSNRMSDTDYEIFDMDAP